MGIIRDTVRQMDGQTDRGYLNEDFFRVGYKYKE